MVLTTAGFRSYVNGTLDLSAASAGSYWNGAAGTAGTLGGAGGGGGAAVNGLQLTLAADGRRCGRGWLHDQWIGGSAVDVPRHLQLNRCGRRRRLEGLEERARAGLRRSAAAAGTGPLPLGVGSGLNYAANGASDVVYAGQSGSGGIRWRRRWHQLRRRRGRRRLLRRVRRDPCPQDQFSAPTRLRASFSSRVASAGAVQAAATGNTGGGGGGGGGQGGVGLIIHGGRFGTGGTGALDVTGGNGGAVRGAARHGAAANGNGGNSGPSGTFLVYDVRVPLASGNFAVGTAAVAHSGSTGGIATVQQVNI